MAETHENPMRKIRIEKVTLNIGAGEPGEKLEKSKKILEKITGKKIIITKTHKRTTFGGAKGRQIGAMTTLRGEAAMKFLKMAFHSVGSKLKSSQFDSTGNFSFGVAEYINLPGIKYDPDIGILGMDVAITLTRPGYRVKKRKLRHAKVGKNQLIKKEEAIEFAKKELGLKIE